MVFSHTIKAQKENMPLLDAVLEKVGRGGETRRGKHGVVTRERVRDDGYEGQEWLEGERNMREKTAGGTCTWRGGKEGKSEYQEEEMCAPPTNVSS